MCSPCVTFIRLSGFRPIYQNKLQEQGIQDVVNVSKINFKPYGNLVDQTFSQFNETLIKNEDAHSQIVNMLKTQGKISQ